MIEEAAGTRLYESKKEAAQRTIEKKDAKLREIDMVHNDWLKLFVDWFFIGFHMQWFDMSFIGFKGRYYTYTIKA